MFIDCFCLPTVFQSFSASFQKQDDNLSALRFGGLPRVTSNQNHMVAVKVSTRAHFQTPFTSNDYLVSRKYKSYGIESNQIRDQRESLRWKRNF